MGGRPLRVITDEEIAQITDAALNNCHLDTIAIALDIPLTTLKRRFGPFIRRLRAQGRIRLRNNQVKLSKVSADMCKFLGKNELNQTDKQVLETKQVEAKTQTDRERKAALAASAAFNDSMSRSGDGPGIVKIGG